MAALKRVNRTKKLETRDKTSPSASEVVISLLADLQQKQDEESERRIQNVHAMVGWINLC